MDVFQTRLHGGDGGIRGGEGVHAALQILQGVDMAGDAHRDGEGLAAGGDGEGAAGALLPGGKEAVFIHRAHRRVGRPGKAGVLGGEIQAAVGGRGLQIHLPAGIQVQGGHRRAGGLVGQGNAVRGADGGDGDRARGVAVVGGHPGGAALRPGGEQAVLVHRAAALGDLPLHLISAGDADGGGAAAVHADGLHTAQLNEALGHLGLGGPHAEAGLLAVQGVKHQGAVGLDADGGPGGAGGVQSGGRLPVGHQLGHAAQGLIHIIPPGVGAGDGKGHRVAGHQGPQLRQGVRVVLGVEGEHRLALGNGDAAGGLQHLLHHVLGLPADAGLGGMGAALILHGGENHVHPGLAVLGGVGKVRGQQGQAAAAVAAGHLAHLVDAAAEVEGRAAQGHRHGQPVLGDEGGAVVIEADGPGAAVVAGGPHHPVGDHQAGGRAGGEHIPVPVEAGDHPLALALQLLGHAGEGHPVGDLGAVGHGGGHVGTGGVGDIVLGTQIRIGVAPEIVGGQGGAHRDGRCAGM